MDYGGGWVLKARCKQGKLLLADMLFQYVCRKNHIIGTQLLPLHQVGNDWGGNNSDVSHWLVVPSMAAFWDSWL